MMLCTKRIVRYAFLSRALLTVDSFRLPTYNNHLRPFSSSSTIVFAGKTITKSSSQKTSSYYQDREKELANFATKLNVDSTSQLKLLLKEKRSRMDGNSENAKYLDWLLVNEEESKQQRPKKDQQQSNKQQKLQKQPKATSSTNNNNHHQQPSFLTEDNFQDRTDIHPASKKALSEIFKITSMTEIQSKTFVAASSGKDVLGRARTGTGKTLAFLLPTLERIVQQQEDSSSSRKNIRALIISPTRELATQIGDQAEKLVTFHNKNFNVQVVFGGTNMKRDIKRLESKLPTILVATPGRLLDHMESTYIRGKSLGKDIMSQMEDGVVVLDETDRLLDMGFRREINKILSYLPSKERRQTLLFSATIPKELKGIMAENMKSDYIEVDCISDKGDDDTHTKIQQSHVIVPTMDRYVSSVVEIVKFAMKQDTDYKIVAFFPTARMVAYYAELFNNGGLNIPVIELHSKKSQSYRNKASERFRAATKSSILFTSDVSARGVDYPGVTQVIQFGIPDNREQYIHRLGRTGRAGKEGKGWLVLGSFESSFIQKELNGLDIPQNNELSELLRTPIETETSVSLERALRKNKKSANGAYQAFLGFYRSKMKALHIKRKEDVVAIANDFSNAMGLSEVPGLTSKMVGKMGLKGIVGITIKEDDDRGGRPGRPGSRSNGRTANGGKRRKSRSNNSRTR